MGAEEEEYELILDDVGSCLVYMYTPVTAEGAKGEPQYAITDYVKAGLNLIDVVSSFLIVILLVFTFFWQSMISKKLPQ